MKCGQCGSEMEVGEAALRFTGWGLFFFGASFKHLYFKAKGAGPKNKKIILRNNHCATAYQCNACGITSILSDGKEKNMIHW